jgi:large subunit ribosomal protein L2
MKTYKPTSKSRRQMTTVTYRGVLSGDKPFKSLLSSKKRQAGRNNQGRITTRHQGGGHKRRFRDIDFSYNKMNIPAKVETVEYDPYRTAFISRVVYADGERRYVLNIKDMKVGDSFIVGEDAPIKTGNRMPLGKIPSGTFISFVQQETTLKLLLMMQAMPRSSFLLLKSAKYLTFVTHQLVLLVTRSSVL